MTIMIRTQIYLTEKQRIVLRRLAKEAGLRMSDIIRRIIDKYIEDNDVPK